MRKSGFLEGILVLVLITSGILGWGWLMQVTVQTIEVRGAENALPAEVRELAGVDSGAIMFKIRTDDIEERISRHPWVEHVGITRMPTGSLIYSIIERAPVVQIMLPTGRPGFYLDQAGYAMNPTDSTSYDVPLLSGYAEDFHPAEPSTDEQTLTLLAALVTERERAGILISEIIIRNDGVWLWLEPSGAHPAMPVRLGDSDIPEKLNRLAAFWTQRISRSQDRKFELIDLRFSSQIITREEERVIPDSPSDP